MLAAQQHWHKNNDTKYYQVLFLEYQKDLYVNNCVLPLEVLSVEHVLAMRIEGISASKSPIRIQMLYIYTTESFNRKGMFNKSA